MGKTVFLVDDMDFSRNILRRILEKIGYTVIGEASDGIEALESLEEINVDIVITDIVMPFMNGVEFLRKFREINKETKVIVMSSTGYDDRIKKIYEYGGNGFLTKPYTEKQIKEILENL
ncbi:MAG: response regulator [Fusobacteria bacterium]|nr:response regulator [Fusobacteriota bacterium]